VCRLYQTAAFHLALYSDRTQWYPFGDVFLHFLSPRTDCKRHFFLLMKWDIPPFSLTPEVRFALGNGSHYIQTVCFLLIWLDSSLCRDIYNTIPHGPFQVYSLLHREYFMPLKHQDSAGIWIYVSNLKSIGVPESFSVLFLTISNGWIKDTSSACLLHHDKAWIYSESPK